ncbi:hypothetical protein M405DRAFT_935716, partial [Rhizopogon salebrosus TDB-379]
MYKDLVTAALTTELEALHSPLNQDYTFFFYNLQAMTFTRHLTFQSKDLGAEAQLVLQFSMAPQTANQNKSQTIVWKVKTFPAKGSCDLQVTYVNQ